LIPEEELCFLSPMREKKLRGQRETPEGEGATISLMMLVPAKPLKTSSR